MTSMLLAIIAATSTCPTPKLNTYPHVQWKEGEVTELIEVMQAGCKKYYSEKHCALEITKRAELSYYVTCGIPHA